MVRIGALLAQWRSGFGKCTGSRIDRGEHGRQSVAGGNEVVGGDKLAGHSDPHVTFCRLASVLKSIELLLPGQTALSTKLSVSKCR